MRGSHDQGIKLPLDYLYMDTEDWNEFQEYFVPASSLYPSLSTSALENPSDGGFYGQVDQN